MIKQVTEESTTRVGRGLRAVASLPRPTLRLLAGAREAGFLGLGPIDYISRLIEGRGYLPPLSIRSHAGPLSGLESSGAEFVAYLKLLCGATPSARVLDIGCGFGLLGLYLKSFLLHPGRYVGVDVDRRAIDWARKHIVSENSKFEFVHLDLRNAAYNPHGARKATDFDLSLPSGSFDIVVLKSVFTHLHPDEVRNYLAQTAHLLDRGGVCLATFFLLNEVQEGLGKRGRNSIDFRFDEGTWRCAVREMPELAVAYSEAEVGSMLADAKLTAKQTFYGSWSGRADGLSYQDVLLLAHR